MALSTQAQVKFGVKAGMNVSTQSGYKDLLNQEDLIGELGENVDVNIKSKLGFHVGAVLQYNFSNSGFFLQPELLYSNLGLKAEAKLAVAGGGIYSESDKLNLHYLQLPVYAGYKINAGLGLNILLGVGPYIGYGISGNDDVFDGMYKRFDFGLSAMGGVQYNSLQITLGYDLGLIDLIDAPGWKTAKDLMDLSSICNRNLKVSVAYLF